MQSLIENLIGKNNTARWYKIDFLTQKRNGKISEITKVMSAIFQTSLGGKKSKKSRTPKKTMVSRSSFLKTPSMQETQRN